MSDVEETMSLYERILCNKVGWDEMVVSKDTGEILYKTTDEKGNTVYYPLEIIKEMHKKIVCEM